MYALVNFIRMSFRMRKPLPPISPIGRLSAGIFETNCLPIHILSSQATDLVVRALAAPLAAPH
jgi:hypothetical protein